MRIFSLKHTYYVVQQLFKNDDYDIFFCLEEEDEGKNEYTIIRIWNQALSYPIIPIFMDMMEQNSMDDFKECFSDGGSFCLVFCRYHAPLLAARLSKEHLSLSERLIIAEHLLERIIILNMPEFLLKDVLQIENIVVTDDLSVQFNYLLNGLLKEKEKSSQLIVQRLADVMKQLFERELTDQSSKELTKFIQSIQEKNEIEFLELYRSFHELSELLSSKDLAGEVKPRRIWFRIWDRIKKSAKILKAVASVLIIVLVAVYLVYTWIHQKPDTMEKTVFHYIGDVEITEMDESAQTDAQK